MGFNLCVRKFPWWKKWPFKYQDQEKVLVSWNFRNIKIYVQEHKYKGSSAQVSQLSVVRS